MSRKRRRGSVRASTLRGLRSVLYAGSRIECRLISVGKPGRGTIPFWACLIARVGRFCMTTPHPYLHSSLPIVTCSTGRIVRLGAYRLSFPLSIWIYQTHAEGRCCLPFTREMGVDVYEAWNYHRTHMDTQLSKINAVNDRSTLAAHPPLPRMRQRFRTNGSHTSACSRHADRGFDCCRSSFSAFRSRAATLRNPRAADARHVRQQAMD